MPTKISTIVTRARRTLLESLALIRPTAPVVGPQGVTGATTYSYVIVGKNNAGTTDAGQVGSTAIGNAVLSVGNFNQLNWANVAGNNGYDIYRTVGGGSLGKIGSTAADVTTFNDTGLAGDASTAPIVNTSGKTGIFWADDELADHAIAAIKDCWRRFVDLRDEHFVTIDETNMNTTVGSTTIAGVPADMVRVLLIEPRDTSDSSSFAGLRFRPAEYNSKVFKRARSLGTMDPTNGGTVYFCLLNAGSPVAAPTIKIGPALSSIVPLRVEYIPTVPATLSITSDNPIPGESDRAIECFVIAHGLAKAREDHSPDPNWVAEYHTEKESAAIVSTPRQEQEPMIVPGVFDDYLDDADDGF